MPKNFKQASDEVMAILHNARKMAIVRQNRRLAMDVLHACSLYVKGIKFPCDPMIFERLAASIIDKQTPAIIEEFAKVEKSLAAGFDSSEKMNWRTVRLPNRR